MSIEQNVLSLIDQALGLQGRSASFNQATPLLGALPEFDSIAVVSILTAIEDQLGLTIADDEISGEIFQTVGTLTQFVKEKLGS